MIAHMSDGDADRGAQFRPVLVEAQEDQLPPEQSRLRQFWRRYARNRLAVFGLIVLLVMIGIGVAAPWITPGVTPDTRFLEPPYLFSYVNFHQYGPSLAYFPDGLFGYTTGNGPYFYQSVLAEITYGARETMFIIIAAALLVTLVGTVLGAISGYFGDWIDAVIMRITDVFLALPFLPLAIAFIIAADLNQLDATAFIVIFTLAGWPPIARLVRAAFLTLRTQPFAEAAIASGVGDRRIIFRHLLPNAVAPIVAATTVNAGTLLAAQATLDYLNLSTPAQTDLFSRAVPHTWGAMVAQAEGVIGAGYWWWLFFPTLFILLTVLAFNSIGEGLRDTLDQRDAR